MKGGLFLRKRLNFSSNLLQKRFFAGTFKQTKADQDKGGAFITNTFDGSYYTLFKNLQTCRESEIQVSLLIQTLERLLVLRECSFMPEHWRIQEVKQSLSVTITEVHYGNTVMDYMEQERKRGITIRAATIAFNWEGHQINLIDTPGHVDFTAEVERSLRVVDGAVAIFDAMQGVETQSETVWMQANKYKIPRIAFINKLDRQGSNMQTTVESVKRRLKVEPLLVNIPSNDSSLLKGIIDLPSMTYYEYLDDKGKMVNIEEVDKSHQLYDRTRHYRTQLIESLANYNEALADSYLSGADPDSIEQTLIEQAIVNAINSQKSVALFCGSALKNKGVQPLMDAIIKYLPSPVDVVAKGVDFATQKELTRKPLKKEKLCALAFKVVNDKEKGLVTFFRVYSGMMKNRQKILNSNLNKVERIQSLYRVRADEAQILNEISVGDIGAIAGCKEIRSGDTIIEEGDTQRIILEGVKMPPAVFFCQIEPQNSRDQQELEKILQNLSREDPSISVKNDEETGQLIISGLGELHLEILRDRIDIEYGIKCDLGKMRVAYRESVGKIAEATLTLEKIVNGQNMYAQLKLSIESTLDDIDVQEVQKKKFEALEFEGSNDAYQMTSQSFNLADNSVSGLNNDQQLSDHFSKNEIMHDYESLDPVQERVKLEGDEYETKRRKDQLAQASLEVYRSLDSLPIESRVTLRQAIEDSLQSGQLLGYPLVNVRVRILDGRWSNLRSKNPLIFHMCATQLMKQLIDDGQPCILEPFMNVEISIPDFTVGDILSDITSKRGGNIIGIRNVKARFIDEKEDNIVDEKKRCINALIPLSEMVGYSTYLRQVTKGEGQFVMNFSHYEKISGDKQEQILQNPYHF